MDALFSFLGELQTWHWLAFALLLLIAEIATGTTYLLWPAAAAGLVGAAMAITPLNWPAQLGTFAVLTLVLTVTGRTYVKGRWLTRGAPEQLNERSAAMIGQLALADVQFSAGIGRVKIGDSVWRAASDEAISPGDRVEIVGVEGVTLKVKRAG